MKINSYETAATFLNGATVRILRGKRSTRIACVIPGRIDVMYHGTAVVTFHRNGSITLNSGGYRTVTTKRRMCEHTTARVFQKRGTWYVEMNGGIREFTDHMLINPSITDYKRSFLPLD